MDHSVFHKDNLEVFKRGVETLLPIWIAAADHSMDREEVVEKLRSLVSDI